MEESLKTRQKSQNNNAIFLVIAIPLLILMAAILIFYESMGLLIFGLVLGIWIILLFAASPQWLFYIFMLTFILGETSFGEYLIQLSVTNILVLSVGGVFLFKVVTQKVNLTKLFYPHQKKFIFFGSLTLLLTEFFSAMVNSAYQGLVMRVSYLLVIFLVFTLVRNKQILFRGYSLGVFSIGILSILTILRSMNLISIGYRANHNWGTAPWEHILPRSIGLPGLDGGMHGIFIISLLPLALLLALGGKRIRIKFSVRILYAVIFLLGVAAVAISVYRSSWLGLVAAICTGIWAYYRNQVKSFGKLFFFLILTLIIIVTIVFYGNDLYSIFHRVFYEVRLEGVEARLKQYEFVIEKMTHPSIYLLVGHSYDRFGDDFLSSLSQYELNQNPEFTPFLHNHFLWILYAAGWPSLLIYLIILVRACFWLIQGSNSKNVMTKIYSSSTLAGIVGIFIILNLTSRYSGHFILWILIASSAIIPVEDTSHVMSESI